MIQQSLKGAWEFSQAGTQEWLPATVPGGVHTDLLALGRIPDPFAGDNELRVAWVAEADWSYRLHFAPSAGMQAAERIFLVCEGLDTLATVTLNGRVLGSTDNMFRRYEWEVTSLLNFQAGNELVIDFASAVRAAAEKQASRPLPGVSQAIPGGPHLRKAPCQFGWDWGPQLPPVGIWKAIRLEGYREVRLSEVHLRQSHTPGGVTISARVAAERWGSQELSAVLHVIPPQGAELERAVPLPADGEASLSLLVPDPQLWWPNGYGAQPLYQVMVTLFSGEGELDRRQYQVGLRTLELRQEPDAWGHSFTFVVNGVSILCKGANWIPADSFPTRLTEASLEGLIAAAAETHQNMLRVWGGGFYEDERFYDLCDRYGILVWQEFIFSCSIYPLDDPEFVENVRQEALENIRRLRHRASLALWCGNNEMEWGWVDWHWDRPELQELKAAYDAFFHCTLLAWVHTEDPDHDYWPSSPSSDTPFRDPNGHLRGDAHYWDVWHGRKPFTAYRGQYPRFMSEFGFQALPPLETIRTYAHPADWNMTSYIMEQHQKNASGNSLMVGQMLDTFRLPRDFTHLVYLSMALQAEGIRYGVEHWRRYPQRVAGILYWQLNDCWPVASWSSLDYFGRWKALHYAARRFFAPLLLSIEDQPSRQNVYLSNDALHPWEGTLRWTLETLDGTELAAGQCAARVESQSAALICELDFSRQATHDTLRRLVFVAELWQADALIARQVAYFVPVKHLELTEPGITAQVEAHGGRLSIELRAHSLAPLVELALDGADAVFSDNYFNLPAGRSVTVTCPLPAGWSAGDAAQALRICSVYDSYEHIHL
jgi:beta-mannosidase